MRALLLARAHFALPIAADAELVQQRKKGGKKPVAKTAPDLPLRMAVFAEEAAAAAGGKGRLHVQRFYDRSFVLLILLGARLGNFLSIRELRLGEVGGRACATGLVDLKDGSQGCWCGFPVGGFSLTNSWIEKHLQAVNERGAFPRVRRGGASFGGGRGPHRVCEGAPARPGSASGIHSWRGH